MEPVNLAYANTEIFDCESGKFMRHFAPLSQKTKLLFLFLIALLVIARELNPSVSAAELAPVSEPIVKPELEIDYSINAILAQGSDEPSNISCPAGYTKVGGPYHTDVKNDLQRKHNFSIPAAGDILVTGWTMEGHPELGCSPAGDTPFEPHSHCSQTQTQESYTVRMRSLSDYSSLSTLGTYHDKADSSKENWWFPAGTFNYEAQSSGQYELNIVHHYGNGNSVDYKLITCFKEDSIATPIPETTPTSFPQITPTPPTSITPAPEPDVSCPASYTKIGGIYHNSIKLDEVRSYNINVPTVGEILITGAAMEGHPERGCSPSGDTGNEPHSSCSQNQKGENFNVSLVGNLGTYDLGTYFDKRDPERDNWWFDAGPFSKNVLPGPYTIEIRDPSSNGNSVDFKLVACHRSTMASPTPTLISNTPTPTQPANTPTPTSTQPANTPTPTNTPSPTPSPTPVRSDMAIKIDVIKPDSVPPVIQLSDKITIEASVRNLGYSPSSNMVAEFDYPIYLEVSASDLTAHNGWSCTPISNLIRCTKPSMPVSTTWEKIATLTGRVPGTYQSNFVTGDASVTNDNFDPYLSNNTDDYSIEVRKVWVSGDIPSPSFFLHARYSDSFSALESDFLPDEVVPNPFQVDLDISIGMTMPSTPYLTTEFCASNPTADGCDQDTDRIYGTMLLKSYNILGMTQIDITDKSVLGVNLVSSPTEVNLGSDNFGRFTEPDPTDCLNWRSIMGGQGNCVTLQDDVDSTWSLPHKNLYRWIDQDYTRVVLQSKGGNTNSCPAPLSVSACIFSDDGQPGYYETTGDADYQIVFSDDHNRIPTSPYSVDANQPFTFYIQMVAPFVEPVK